GWLVGAVARGGRGLVAAGPGRSGVVGGGEGLASSLVRARLDLLLRSPPRALLAPLRLLANVVGLGLEMLLGAGAGLFLRLPFALLPELGDPLLRLSTDLRGPVHHALLDLGLDLDRDLTRLALGSLGVRRALLGGGDPAIRLLLDLPPRLAQLAVGLGSQLR